MIMQWVAVVLLTISVILQLAVDRAPDLTESPSRKASRRILIVGLGLSAACLWRLIWNGITADMIALLGAILIGLAETIFCAVALFPHSDNHNTPGEHTC